MISYVLFLALAILAVAFAGEFDGWKVQQVHIAQGLTPETMTVSWVTDSVSKSQVRVSRVPFALANNDPSNYFTVSGEETSYTFHYPTDGVYNSGTIHHVTIDNLDPSTTYFYQCGDFDAAVDDSTSGILSFTTQPKIGDTEPYHFAVIGDLGQTTDSTSTINHILANKHLGMILHAGDLSYADCNPTLWDNYGKLIEDLAKERPWMVGPGNHEIEVDSENGNTFLAFEQRYRMPRIQPAEIIGNWTIEPVVNPQWPTSYCTPSVAQIEYNYGNSFYSFEVASAHVIYLNPYSTTDESSVQYQWLMKDLASVDRTVTPWLIVVMHCPFYNSNKAHTAELQATLMRDAMEPLFYKHKVNMVFAGHVHAYERTFPVFQNETVPDAPVYVTIGDGGNYEGHAGEYWEQPSWSAYRNGTQYGHGELSLFNKEKLMWRWMRNVDGMHVSRDELVLCNTYLGLSANC